MKNILLLLLIVSVEAFPAMERTQKKVLRTLIAQYGQGLVQLAQQAQQIQNQVSEYERMIEEAKSLPDDVINGFKNKLQDMIAFDKKYKDFIKDFSSLEKFNDITGHEAIKNPEKYQESQGGFGNSSFTAIEIYKQGEEEIRKEVQKANKEEQEFLSENSEQISLLNETLEKLSRDQSNATTQKQAIQVANQIAQLNTKSLSALRSTMTQQAKTELTKQQATSASKELEKAKIKSLIGEIRVPKEGTEQSMSQIEEELLRQ